MRFFIKILRRYRRYAISKYPSGSGKHCANGLRLRLLFKLGDQSLQLRVTGIEGQQLAGMAECPGKIPVVPCNRDERHQDASIRRMLPVRLFQERQRLSPCTARIQRDGVDIGVARVVGISSWARRSRSNASG